MMSGHQKADAEDGGSKCRKQQEEEEKEGREEKERREKEKWLWTSIHLMLVLRIRSGTPETDGHSSGEHWTDRECTAVSSTAVATDALLRLSLPLSLVSVSHLSVPSLATSSTASGCGSTSSERLNQSIDAAGRAPSTEHVSETISPATTGVSGPRILSVSGLTAE